MVITMNTKAYHWTLSTIQSTAPKSILKLACHLHFKFKRVNMKIKKLFVFKHEEGRKHRT